MIGEIIQRHDPSRTFRLYDSFEHPLGRIGDIRAALLERFRERGIPEPQLHAGRFEDQFPQTLPAKIAFAQIDCGVGGDPAGHAQLIEFCLSHLWPRLSAGAVCILQDYADPDNEWAENYYPYVKPTVDTFLHPLGITATALCGGEYNHAYFRKPMA